MGDYDTGMHYHVENEANQIRMRNKPCSCGCRGRDPQHAKHIKRVITDIEILDEIETAKLLHGYEGTVTIVARGTCKTPRGTQHVGFEVWQTKQAASGINIAWGWVALS